MQVRALRWARTCMLQLQRARTPPRGPFVLDFRQDPHVAWTVATIGRFRCHVFCEESRVKTLKWVVETRKQGLS